MSCDDTGVKYGSPGRRGVVSVGTQGGSREITLRDGFCLDADVVVVDPAQSVVFSAKETQDAVAYYIERKSVTVVDGAAGLVKLDLTSDDLPFAGVWWAAFQVLDSNQAVVKEIPAWLNVLKGLDHAIRENTPLLPSELRLFMMDVCPEDNFLLDDVEFSDEEYLAAIRWVVDEWNETPPSVMDYTPATFPWRRNWMVGAAGYLFGMKARSFVRNHLSYSTGDATIDDKNKQSEYNALAQQLTSEFKDWLMKKKVEINAELCYGSIGSWEFRGGLYL